MKMCKDCKYFTIDKSREYPSHLTVYKCEKYGHTAPIQNDENHLTIKNSLNCVPK